MNSYFVIVILIVVVVLVVLLFKLLDLFLKGGFAKKKTAEKKSATKAPDVEKKQKAAPVENKASGALKIYNSELADDLVAMLKDSNESQESSRLQVEKHMNKAENNISQYIKDKKYRSFDFGTDDANNTEEDEEPMKFTREDYKKFLALSNIDDNKPL